MKQTILKYISLLALICTLFWSSYLYANDPSSTACASGSSTLVGCAISTSDITYTITGDIDADEDIRGIAFTAGADNNNLTLNGNISTESALGISPVSYTHLTLPTTPYV